MRNTIEEIKLPGVRAAIAGIVRKDKKLVATAPGHGPWYYLYLKPEWRLVALPTEGDDENDHRHEALWTEYCVEEIARHYHIRRRSVLDELAELPRAMPRGRCMFTPRGNHRRWTFYHGNDFPRELDRHDEEITLIGKYSLAPHAIQSWVHFEYVQHEEMSARQKSVIQKILGPIPY